MDLQGRWPALLLTLLFFFASTGFGQEDVEVRKELKTKKTDLERALERLQERMESETSLAGFAFPEDTTQRFPVKELRISGNSLISTAEIIEKLPASYTVSVRKAETTVEEVYDFRVVRDIILNPGTAREVSLRTIQGLTRYILSLYQDKGYAGVYVYVPAESVAGAAKLVDEILAIQVLEGEVADITIDRYDFDRKKQEKGFLKDSALKSWSPIKQGQVIQKKKLDEFVGLLNLNPDRYVSAVISRGREPNALNLGYDVYEADPWHWYLQVDNSGTKERQWSPKIGVVNTNLTGMDDRFSAMYQAPWEKGIEDEYALYGSYDFPLFTPWLRLNLYGGYSQFDITTKVFNFLGNGSFFGGILSYNILQINDWFLDVTGSLSHEKSRVTPSLGIQTDVDMDLWGIGANLHHSDDMSDTSLSFNRVENVSGSNRADTEVELRLEDADFTIYTLFAAHSQYLDTNKVNRLGGTFRWIVPDERLVPAKMTTFGGLYSVRGYKEDEIVADGGIIASGQYEFDLVKYGSSKEKEQTGAKDKPEKKPWLRKLAPLAFVDYGRAKIKSPTAGDIEIRKLASVGTGLLVELGDSFSAGIYYGLPLRSTDDTDRGDGRFSFSFLYRF